MADRVFVDFVKVCNFVQLGGNRIHIELPCSVLGKVLEWELSVLFLNGSLLRH